MRRCSISLYVIDTPIESTRLAVGEIVETVMRLCGPMGVQVSTAFRGTVNRNPLTENCIHPVNQQLVPCLNKRNSYSYLGSEGDVFIFKVVLFVNSGKLETA